MSDRFFSLIDVKSPCFISLPFCPEVPEAPVLPIDSKCEKNKKMNEISNKRLHNVI